MDTGKLFEAFGNILHVPGMFTVPAEYAQIVSSAKWGEFKAGTPGACRYVDVTFVDATMFRFVTQNKDKKYEAGHPKVNDGTAQIGQLKPYAMQALGGAQITWVIANPYGPNELQVFRGHVFNGVWKPKQENAYDTTTQPQTNTTNVVPGTYVPTQGVANPTTTAPAAGNNALDAMMPALLAALQKLNSTTKEEDEQPAISADGHQLQI